MTAQASVWRIAPLYPSGVSSGAAGGEVWRRLRVSRALNWVWSAIAHAGDEPAGSGARMAGQSHAHAPAGLDAEYEAFVREHQRAILNYLWRMTSDEQAAYDLTQEVFVRAWRHFSKLRGYERPRGWLFRVATNLALSGFAARKAPLASIDALGADQGPAVSDPAWRVVERDLVRATLDGLSPRRRAALTLREVYGCSMAEVAQALGVSEVAARMTLSRAREQFRERYLKEQGDEHGA